MTDSRPAWAQRIRVERAARGWSQAQAVAALRAHADVELPGQDSMLRRWKSWEAGGNMPDDFYRPLIARTFGTVTGAFFADPTRRDGNAEIIAATGMDTLDIISRLQASDVDAATLNALRITVDRLCSEYPYMPSAQLALQGREWLRRIAELQGQRLALAQHREMLAMAGWLALLVGCVEYDMKDRRTAETTRRAALSLGNEAGNSEIVGWAHEMRAWFALTTGDYRGVIAASEAGSELARGRPVAVQLAGQEAKAWARIGDRRQTEVALDRGRALLEVLPHPDNLDNHFTVDPSKFDFWGS
ncbi:MAG: XRE family transcriptional regulator [Actinobacteria bacterium]|nr:XRE family transcriptional regulator [Actinomycetota bacterium]